MTHSGSREPALSHRSAREFVALTSEWSLGAAGSLKEVDHEEADDSQPLFFCSGQLQQ
jgi:hypothetical protein